MPQPNPEGRIDVTLVRRGAGIGEVRIASSRPQLAQRLLAGRSPERAAELAGMLYTVCGRAQRIACQAAAEAASGRTPGPETCAGRELEVLAETAREHVWQLLVRGPQLAGQAPETDALRAVQQAKGDVTRLAGVLGRLLGARLLGEAPEDWLGRGPDGLGEWIAAAPTPVARLLGLAGGRAERGSVCTPLLPPLHRLEDSALRSLARQALDAPDWCARPLWQGSPAETGALARLADTPPVSSWLATRGPGAQARLLARLVELAGLPRRLNGGGAAVVRAWPLEQGVGVAGVETSRGLLLHIVRLQAGRIVEYRILAPTEWNFHPAGPLAQALSGLPADGRLATRARLEVLSLDPCVEFALEVRDA